MKAAATVRRSCAAAVALLGSVAMFNSIGVLTRWQARPGQCSATCLSDVQTEGTEPRARYPSVPCRSTRTSEFAAFALFFALFTKRSRRFHRESRVPMDPPAALSLSDSAGEPMAGREAPSWLEAAPPVVAASRQAVGQLAAAAS